MIISQEPTVQCVDLGEVVQEDRIRQLVPVEDAVDVFVIDSDPLAEVLVADLEPGGQWLNYCDIEGIGERRSQWSSSFS